MRMLTASSVVSMVFRASPQSRCLAATSPSPPTTKVTSATKALFVAKKPFDSLGGRSAKDIVSSALDAAKQLALDRLNGKSSGSKSSGSGSDNSKTEVIELTDDNFEALVLNSQDLWLVEFFGLFNPVLSSLSLTPTPYSPVVWSLQESCS